MPSTTTVQLRVNGTSHDVTAAPETPLLYILRNDLALSGPKFGCGLGQCGACMVHLDGATVRSCTTPLSAAARGNVTTIEGLGSPDKPHPVQQAFIEEQAAQCGYCSNGMIMASAALIARNKQPTRPQIRATLNANLCRCGTHMRIIRAVERAAQLTAAQSAKGAGGNDD
ncbi:MAG TPA: (2Fe-2S)-binding protein [Gemmatimonadaceae bacterium]|nr:(2Fe-2S)-binding protein [Gemmatimonadaceae bacterium]